MEPRGILTQKLEETREELEGLPQSEGGPKETGNIEVQDIENIRQILQKLTRSANPLGRLVEALQEDIETILKEGPTWEEEYKRNSSKLQQERASIDVEVESLRQTLQKLQREVEEEKEKIDVTRASIERKEENLRRTIAWVCQGKKPVGRTATTTISIAPSEEPSPSTLNTAQQEKTERQQPETRVPGKVGRGIARGSGTSGLSRGRGRGRGNM